jgi:hypothetical protein
MSNNEFKDLVNQYCNGTISDTDAANLEEELLQNKAHRNYFNSFMNLDANLKEEAAAPDEEIESKKSFPIRPLIAFAAIILLSFNLVYLVQSNKNTVVTISKNTPTQTGLGIITKALNIKGSHQKMDSGRILEPGVMDFHSGIIQVEMFSGASLVLHGPVKIKFIDPMKAQLLYGHIRARVPKQAQGFTLLTKDMNIVDLGTEFTLKVEPNKAPQVYVHEGEVLLNETVNNKTLKSVKTAEGYSWVDEQFTATQKSPKTISFDDLEKLNKDFRQEKLNAWQDFAKSLKQRKDVVLFYSFQDQAHSSRVIKNQSLVNDENLNGSIVGAKWSQGRWPGKAALAFRSTGDRIRLNIPGEFDSITFSTWIQICSFDRWLSSLILTDNYDKGELHWQLSDSGEIILGARQNGNTFSPPIITPKDLGRWIHIATVYDSESLAIRHYLDGKEIHTKKIKRAHKIKLGKSDIGNWTTNQQDNAIRSLNGTMDEFIIFSKALSSKEVDEIYLLGKPN